MIGVTLTVSANCSAELWTQREFVSSSVLYELCGVNETTVISGVSMSLDL